MRVVAVEAGQGCRAYPHIVNSRGVAAVGTVVVYAAAGGNVADGGVFSTIGVVGYTCQQAAVRMAIGAAAVYIGGVKHVFVVVTRVGADRGAERCRPALPRAALEARRNDRLPRERDRRATKRAGAAVGHSQTPRLAAGLTD